MRGYRFVQFVAALFFLASGLAAESVTLTVVQNEAAPAIAKEMSKAIEDEILGDYFDAGHIVTNTDMRFDGSRFSESYFGIKDAAQGFSDYLLAVSLTYGAGVKKDEPKGKSWAELTTLEWKLVRVSDSAIISGESLDVTKTPITDSDPYSQSRLIAAQACARSLAAIAKAK